MPWWHNATTLNSQSQDWGYETCQWHLERQYGKNTINKVRYLITGSLVAQWLNTALIILRLRVQSPPLALGEKRAKILSIRIRHLISFALVAQWYNTQFTIRWLRVQILPLDMGERKWQKILSISSILNYWCTGSTAVLHSTRNPKIEGSNPVTGIWRGNIAKILSIKLGIE